MGWKPTQVLDVEAVVGPGGGGKGRGEAGAGAGPGRSTYQLAEVEVVKSSDFGVFYRCLTHLGALLQPGDSVLG